MRFNAQSCVVHVALLGLWAWSALAADFAAPIATHPPPVAGGADYAAELARVQTGGRVLDVRPALDSAESAYEVRVLLDAGRVRRIVIDVESGQVK
jgi:hypothetical protein